MMRHIFLCLVLVFTVMPGECRTSVPSAEEWNSRVQLSIQLDSKWTALNTCRDANLIVTYRNNSEEPVLIFSPRVLDLEFRKGKHVVTEFDGFTYETNIYVWGIILEPKSEYCTKIPLLGFLRTKAIVPGGWSVKVQHRGMVKNNWVGSEFRGMIRYVKGKNVKSEDAFYDTIISSEEGKNRYYLLIKKDQDERERIEIMSGTLVSNSTKLIVERCGWLEKLLWNIKTWLRQL